MPRSVREYHRPADEAAALEVLGRSTSAAAPLVLGPRVPDAVYDGVEAAVDLSRLELNYFRQDDDGLRLGALTPLQDLAEAETIKSMAGGVLAKAAELSAGSTLRQVATLGGAVMAEIGAGAGVERRGPPEVVLALLALDAEVVVHSAGEPARSVALEEFLGMGQQVAPGELLAEIALPVPEIALRGALTRVARTPRDQAIVAAIVVIAVEGGTVNRISLAVAGANGRPTRLRALEQSLFGQAVTAERLADVEAQASAALEPSPHFLASAEYQQAMAGILVRRALAEAAGPPAT